MHPEPLDAVARLWKLADVDYGVRHRQLTGLDVGGRNVNGSARQHMPNIEWHGLDIRPGPDVDIVADAASYRLCDGHPGYNVVMATEPVPEMVYSPKTPALS